MNHQLQPTEYESFQEIIDDLMKPIGGEGLTVEMVIRLYESKLAYLENIRIKCFRDINRPAAPGVNDMQRFQVQDYDLILAAIDLTKKTLKYTVLTSVTDLLKKV